MVREAALGRRGWDAEVMEDRIFLHAHATLREGGAAAADEVASVALSAAKKAMGITSLSDFQ